jgi:hypothetical protein
MEDSQVPFHLIDLEKLKIKPLPINTVVPKVIEQPQEEKPILYNDPDLETLTRIVTHPEFKPKQYVDDNPDDEGHSTYVSIRDTKYSEKKAGVTQPLFYVGITTDPVDRYKNDRTAMVAQNFELVTPEPVSKNTARGIEQLLILLNNNGSSFPALSRTLDNERNSTAPSREIYIVRLVLGYLYLGARNPGWQVFYYRDPKNIEIRLKTAGQWNPAYTPQK